MANETLKDTVLFYSDVHNNSSGSEMYHEYNEGGAEITETHWNMNCIPNSNFSNTNLMGPYSMMDNASANTDSEYGISSVAVMSSMSSTQSYFFLITTAQYNWLGGYGATIRVGDELIIMHGATTWTAGVIIVACVRGQYGTTKTSHTATTAMKRWGGEGLVTYVDDMPETGDRCLLMKAGNQTNAYLKYYTGPNANLCISAPGDVFTVEAKFFIPSQFTVGTPGNNLRQPNYPGSDAAYPIRMFVFGLDSGEDWGFSADGDSPNSHLKTYAINYSAQWEGSGSEDKTTTHNPIDTDLTDNEAASAYEFKFPENTLPRDQWFTCRVKFRFGNYKQILSIGCRLDVGQRFNLYYVDDWRLYRDGLRLSVLRGSKENISLGDDDDIPQEW